jgi:hypothetical protein
LLTRCDIYRAEKGAIVRVCNIDDALSETLGLKSSLVSLSKDSLEHIRQKHPDITEWDILMLPEILKKGMVVREKSKPQFVVFSLFCSEIPRKRLNATVKFLPEKYENYVSTLHRAKYRELKRLLKRGDLLRRAKM